MAQPHEVVSTDYPYLTLRVEVQGQNEKLPALLDTGYTGALIIPTTWRRRLGRPDGRSAVEVADGRTVFAPVYLATVEIIGFEPMYGVAATLFGDEYILGRRVLDRFEITFDHGQRVIVRP